MHEAIYRYPTDLQMYHSEMTGDHKKLQARDHGLLESVADLGARETRASGVNLFIFMQVA